MRWARVVALAAAAAWQVVARREVLGFVGLAILAWGAGQVFEPLAPMVAGGGLFWLAARRPAAAQGKGAGDGVA